MKNEQKITKEIEMNEVLVEYSAQTAQDEDVHFEHVDWTYSDSSCCC